jgi:hypothetical protein
MAVPRPLLLALLGTVLLAVTFMATLSSREQATDTVSTPALEQQPAPAPPAPSPNAAVAPADVAKAVFAPPKPIDSAAFDIRFNAQELTGSRERQALRLTGSFQSTPDKIPSFDIRTSEVTDGKATHSRVLSTGDKGYLFNGVTGFEVGDRTMAGAAALREAIAKGSIGPSGQVAEPDPSSWLRKIKAEKPVMIDGVKTTHISAVIAPKLAAAGVQELVKSVRGASAEPVRLPGGVKAKVRRALKTARLEAWVGTDDRVLRRLTIDVRGAFPAEVLEAGESARWHMGLDVNLSKVNKPQQIEAPKLTDPRKPAKGLGPKTARESSGVFALGALFTDPPASFTKTGFAVYQADQRSKDMRKPRAVKRAMQKDKRVVIFFHQPNGVDDAITDDAVAALRKRSSAVVFQDVVSNVASYGQVVIGLGVTRAPAIVTIGKSGRARLIEGYIDSAALAQEVADTR